MIVSTLGLEAADQALMAQAAAGRAVMHTTLKQLSPEELAQVDALFTYGYDIPAERLAQMPALRWIHIGQSGMDKIPMKVLSQRAICLSNSRGINSVAIAEYAMSMMLNIVRKNPAFYDAAREKKWDLDTHLDELAGKTVGILGLGKVVAGLARRAAAFDMRVLGMEISPREVEHVEKVYLPAEKNELLPQCDFVVISMPLTPQTHHLFDAATLQILRPNAWLINVGRGPIIDDAALIQALESRAIGGAVLDVFETEPLPANHPLWSLPNTWITPHIAGDHLATYMPRMMAILCRNLSAYISGRPLENLVDVNRGF